MTKGDNYNLACPYCFRLNHYLSQDLERSSRNCVNCGRRFIVYPQHTIILKANTLEEDPYEFVVRQSRIVEFDYINGIKEIIENYSGIREANIVVRFPNSSLCKRAIVDIINRNLSVSVDGYYDYMFLIPNGFNHG